MIAAFKSAAIDAAFPPAPFTTQIIRDNSAENFGGPIRRVHLPWAPFTGRA